MKRNAASLAVCLAIVVTSATPANAQRSGRYPRVYSPTGRPYGSSVAEFQWQRQYGTKWHGYRGISSTGRNSSFRGIWPGYFPGYVGNYGLYPAYYTRLGCGCRTFTPYRTVTAYRGPSLYDFHGVSLNSVPIFGELSVLAPPPPTALTPLKQRISNRHSPLPQSVSSTLEEQARSAGKLHAGDFWLQKLDFANAKSDYRAAMLIAPDQARPRFRLGMVLVALSQYPEAIEQFQLGLAADSSWPSTGETLTELFGKQNIVEKSSIVNRAADWVREDIRDPERLFLMGVLLHFDEHDQAGVFFETATQLAGPANYWSPFLQTPGISTEVAPPAPDRAAGSGTTSEPAAAPFVPPLPSPELEDSAAPLENPSATSEPETGPVLLPPNR